ncbi:hypothetical protein [Winogradskya humida]|uniref:Uncharacterized protein n=1 Tax=Winogradskya humida TaxID=113566 RepID=A0ABQ3ZVN5_9ACTN|nr:hypothetical protein [Actinoplanes humidus]GIE22650.1 hypothetical protein Ahu01nite_057520 [Actinoplanes humidus]
MKTVSARRELAIVLALAVFGLGLVMAVAFTPWYTPASKAAPTVVETVTPGSQL